MNITQKIDMAMEKNNSLLCIGLDSDGKKLPSHLQGKRNAQFAFNKAIIDATHDLVCAYKPNSAFYEGAGASGIKQLKKTCDYIRQLYPETIIILDAKRADIGSTNTGYVEYAFNYLCVDAITVHPYVGNDALKPFLDREDKGVIILCRTSNPGAWEFQDLLVDGKPLYQRIAEQISRKWNGNHNCMLVVGATYPQELKHVRQIVGDMTLLIPGIGAQSGDIQKTVKAGINRRKRGMIISSSRDIIFASNGRDFAQTARKRAYRLKNEINHYR